MAFRFGWMWLAVVCLLLACTAPSTLFHALIPQPTDLTPVASNYQPPAEIVQLAQAATMTAKARDIFYAAQPEIDADRATFEQHCQAPISSNSIELGCYTSDNRIYILLIAEPQLKEEMVVTAAHEMLHAAYGQLDQSQLDLLNPELENQVSLIHSVDLNAVLRDYRITEPGQRDNELHSIIGTEYAPLAPALEQYYSQYFTNRQAVVADARQFNQVFAQLKATLNNLQTQISQLRSQMAADRRRGNRAAYNALVPRFNALVTEYNQNVAEYNALSRSLLGEESPASSQ